MKTFIYCFIVVVLVAFYLPQGYGQNSDMANGIKSAIEGRNFVFQVQSVTPRSGGQMQQRPGFQVSISQDTLKSLLPYFGRIYSPGYGTSDSGIDLTTRDFEYKIEDRKKGGWNIIIKVKNDKSVRQMNFSVFENGSAYLAVTCIDRQSNSYHGTFAPGKLR